MSLTALPGDPTVVATEAKRMQDAAAQMRKAAATLRSLSSSAYRSEAVEALENNTSDMAEIITKAAIRYQGTGDALAEYAPKLDAAQVQAREAIHQLGGTDVEGARHAVDAVEKPFWETAGMDDVDRSQYDADVARAKADLAAQEAAAAAAEALYQEAIRDIDVAARAAMDKIHNANEQSQLNDTLWDDFKGFLADIDEILKALITILDVVGDIIGLIGVILAFVPGLQALAGLLLLISTALSLVTLGLTALRAVSGKATWGDVLSKAIVTAIGLVLKGGKLAKSLGGGRLGSLVTSMKSGLDKGRVALDYKRLRLAFKFRAQASSMINARVPGKMLFDYRSGANAAGAWLLDTSIKYSDKAAEAWGAGSFTFTLSDLIFDTSMGDRTADQWAAGTLSNIAELVADPGDWVTHQVTDFTGDLSGWVVDQEDLADSPMGTLLNGGSSEPFSVDAVIAENFNIDCQPVEVSVHFAGGGGGGGGGIGVGVAAGVGDAGGGGGGGGL